jgi:phosphoenolpyruvate synthase/pyruvate phosphate dikinase
MRKAPGFGGDTDKREKALARFRDEVAKSKVPAWMHRALGEMHRGFPQGTNVRCRSSTNNEDLPGFSGAGLYDSFTNREGHISETVKLVYASLWNFRAYEEREFYRIDHFATAMGVLCHPNYSKEIANGVAVSDDIVYQSGRNYYVNVQVGEDMVTNPDALSIPEELLLSPSSARDDKLIQVSSRAKDGARVLGREHREQLRKHLGRIKRKFRRLYGHKRSDGKFAMEIEFKITAEGKLAIKQARPWVY